MPQNEGFLHQNRTEKTTDVWLTPPWIIEAFGPFDLDPCAANPRPFNCAAKNYTEQDNSLILPWEGLVFMNPPYGRETGVWMDKMAEHNNGIALVFARTATKWWHRTVSKATGILFPNKLIKFLYADGSMPKFAAPSPSCFISFGLEARNRLLYAWSEYNLGMFVEGPGKQECTFLT